MAKKTLLGTRTAVPERGSPAYLRQQYSIGRGNLLAAILFTIFNLVLLFTGSGQYFLFSIAAPYYGVLLGQALGFGNEMLAVATVLLAAYFLCWLLSKKRSGVIAIALILFILDCAALVGIMVLGELYASMTLDILFHVWVVYYLIQAMRCGAKLRAMGNESTAAPTAGSEAPSTRNVGPEIGGKPEIKNRGPEID